MRRANYLAATTCRLSANSGSLNCLGCFKFLSRSVGTLVRLLPVTTISGKGLLRNSFSNGVIIYGGYSAWQEQCVFYADSNLSRLLCSFSSISLVI